MAKWSFDLTTVKFDASVPTWDAGLFADMVRLHLVNNLFVELDLANVRAQAFAYDRAMFRAPYGGVWNQQGDKRRLVESITVQAFVVDDAGGISDAAVDANVVLQALRDVVRVEASSRIWDVVALQPVARQPVESGYRFDITFTSSAAY